MLRQPLPELRPSRAGRAALARPRVPNTHHLPKIADAPPSAATFDQLFALSRDALAVADVASGTIVRWNPAAKCLFGYGAAQAIGRQVDLLMPAAAARLFHERLAHYARTCETDVLDARVPQVMPVHTASGEEVRVECSMAPLDAPGGPPREILLTFRDASCLEQLERRALEAAQAAAALADTARRLERCDHLLNQSAREVQKPLARARRAARRLARLASPRSAELPPAGLASAALAETSPERLALLARVVDRRADEVQRTLDQLAETAALETGSFALCVERVNLVPLVARLIGRTRERSAAHKISMGAPQGLTATVDAHRIELVLDDLISRAMRRNPRGCWIDVDLRRPLTGLARIEVRDYGRRLSAAEREGLLSATGDDRGWFIDRQIVDQHGGDLSLEWPSEGGLRVVVTLPTNRLRPSGQSSA